ncbi:unnamed protein product [Caenorhabditis sp. 36 PRJEB53466]|nr:unnamed protein product [Caenorhabditis sp. 36 PRJEB53466]
MNSFPLLDLSILPGKKTFELFSLFQLVKLVKCSLSAKRAVQMCRLPLSQLEIEFMSEVDKLSAEYSGGGYSFFMTSRSSGSTSNYGKRYDRLKEENRVESLSKLLLETFRVEGISVTFRDPFRSFQELRKCAGVIDAHSVTVDRGELSEEELAYFLVNFKGIHTLNFHSSVPDGYQSFRFDCNTLTIRNGSFLDLQSLLNLKCEHIIIIQCGFTTSDLQGYVNEWRDGKNPQLLSLSLYNTKMDDDILKGMCLEAWDPRRRSRDFVRVSRDSATVINCSEGLDFEREDGTLATILLKRDKTEFQLFVWKNKFPDIPDNAFKM